MANTSLADEIITIVKSVANNNPPPAKCTITKVYEDKAHVDVTTSLGELKYVKFLGADIEINSAAVILFLDDSYNEYIVIANTSLDKVYKRIEEIEKGEIHIEDYDANFTFSFGLSGRDDRITIHTFLEKK